MFLTLTKKTIFHSYVHNNGAHWSSSGFNTASFSNNLAVPHTKDNFSPMSAPANRYVEPSLPSTSRSAAMNNLPSIPHTRVNAQDFDPSYQTFPSSRCSTEQSSLAGK